MDLSDSNGELGADMLEDPEESSGRDSDFEESGDSDVSMSSI